MKNRRKLWANRFSKKCDSDDIQICDKRPPRALSALGAVRNCELPFWRSQLPPRARSCHPGAHSCHVGAVSSQTSPELPELPGASRGFPQPPRASWGGLGSSREVWGGQTAPQYITNHCFLYENPSFVKHMCSKPVFSLGFLVFLVSHCKNHRFSLGLLVFLVFSPN